MSPPIRRSSKSLLKRPRPCSCLVELPGAKNSSCISEDDTSRIQSPSSICEFMDPLSSPWGHFVDLLVPDELDEGETCHRRLKARDFFDFSNRSSSYEPYPSLNRKRSNRS